MSNLKSDNIIDDFFDQSTPEELEQTRLSLDIAMRLHEILEEKGLSQKQLAQMLGKKESEISRWLKGMHNFTTKTIAKLQIALEETIVSVPKGGYRAQKNYAIHTPQLYKFDLSESTEENPANLVAA